MKLRFRTKTRFETEAYGDSEMAYSINILNIQNLWMKWCEVQNMQLASV